MKPLKIAGLWKWLLVVGLLCFSIAARADDPLPSWKDGAAKSTIVSFVKSVTEPNSETFVPPAQRIATFDNDGTLWSEQPLYFQAFYILDRVKAQANETPEWRKTEPFKSAIESDVEGVMASGMAGLEKLLAATHANVTAEQFAQQVEDWLSSARHPQTGKRYTQMVYQPMLELLDYLRANDFETFIVSGGGIDFLRVFAEQVYGIPPEQVVGTTLGAKFEMREGVPTLIKQPELVLLDDKAGKPVGIHQFIGRRPIMAVGNSDGDREMLQYTTIPRHKNDSTPRLGVIIHHTDGEREYAYDRESHIGRLDKSLDEAPKYGWLVVDMKESWKRIYPE